MQGCIPWLDRYKRFLMIMEFAALVTGAIAAGLPVAPCEASTCEQPELAQELAERMQRDQSGRMKLMQAAQEQGIDIDRFAERFPDSHIIQEVKRVDTDNQQWLAKLIAAHGWPGRTKVGEDGAHAAWLLVQHADEQPEFQKQCLALMKKLGSGEVASVDIAYLSDRIRIKEGKKQKYGTQLDLHDGKVVLKPVDDPARLDELRREMGLQPIAEYLAAAQQVFSVANRNETSGARMAK